MTRESVLIVLGVLIALAPWSGVPLSTLSWVLVLLGLLVIGIAVTLRARSTSISIYKEAQ